MEARMWDALVDVLKSAHTVGPGEGTVPRPVIMRLVRGELVGLIWVRPLKVGEEQPPASPPTTAAPTTHSMSGRRRSLEHPSQVLTSTRTASSSIRVRTRPTATAARAVRELSGSTHRAGQGSRPVAQRPARSRPRADRPIESEVVLSRCFVPTLVLDPGAFYRAAPPGCCATDRRPGRTPHRTFHPRLGVTARAREFQLGLPAHPWRTRLPRHQGRRQAPCTSRAADDLAEAAAETASCGVGRDPDGTHDRPTAPTEALDLTPGESRFGRSGSVPYSSPYRRGVEQLGSSLGS